MLGVPKGEIITFIYHNKESLLILCSLCNVKKSDVQFRLIIIGRIK